MLKKTFAAIVILCVVSNSFLFSFAAAVSPWDGNPWDGNPWDGNPWDGVEWEGPLGNQTGGTSNGTGVNGGDYSFEGAPWTLAPWLEQPGPYPGGLNQPGYPGNFQGPIMWPGFTGNNQVPRVLDGNQGLVTDLIVGGTAPNVPAIPAGLSPYEYNAYAQALENGGGVAQKPGVETPEWVNISKYITNDVVMSQVGLAVKATTDSNFGFKDVNSFKRGILWGGMKLGLKDNEAVKTLAELETAHGVITDGYTAAQAIGQNSSVLNGQRSYRALQQAGIASQISSSPRSTAAILTPANGALSKFNVASAAVGTVFGTIETGYKTANAIDMMNSSADTTKKVSATADATASFGQTLMSAGVVAGAIPGGQAAAPIMIAGGAVIWGGSRLVKLAADNWEGIKQFRKDFSKDSWKASKDLAVKAYEGAKNKISDSWSAVKGLFGN